MFVPLWLIGLTVALLVLLAGFALRRRGGEMVERQRRDAGPALAPADEAALAADPEIRAALAGGRKIEAIRLVRGRTGLGLKEAKELVERLGPG